MRRKRLFRMVTPKPKKKEKKVRRHDITIAAQRRGGRLVHSWTRFGFFLWWWRRCAALWGLFCGGCLCKDWWRRRWRCHLGGSVKINTGKKGVMCFFCFVFLLFFHQHQWRWLLGLVDLFGRLLFWKNIRNFVIKSRQGWDGGTTASIRSQYGNLQRITH